jgi:hypothetical protein
VFSIVSALKLNYRFEVGETEQLMDMLINIWTLQTSNMS